ncbi:unnamed protein product [Allacma fusca]|uniref:CRAL-TRIO domain-containing protein n=1 Tax=Allacma fusca TaxID=39272 RepID=A0A8J2LSL9_9HEXA|nr:unnamed protein product [Allacma fusca]
MFGFVCLIAHLYFFIHGFHTVDGKYIGNITEDIENWVPPAEFPEKFPYYISGYDYDNRAILVVELGNSIPYLKRGGQGLEDLGNYVSQFVERVGSGYFTKSPDVNSDAFSDEVIPILDYEGITAEQLFSVENTVFNMDKLGKLNQYYDKIPFGFIVNVSAVTMQFIEMMKPRLGQVFQKMEIYGTQPKVWIPRLLRQLPQDQLNCKYGGVRDCNPVESIR